MVGLVSPQNALNSGLGIFDPNCQKGGCLRMKESERECVIQHNDPLMIDSQKLKRDTGFGNHPIISRI